MVLANQSIGQGSQNAGYIGNAGQAQIAAYLSQGQNIQNLLGNIASAGGYYMGNQPVTANTTVPASSQAIINSYNNQGAY
jgi:hypothetical protein